MVIINHMSTVSIIIPNYNGEYVLSQNIPRVIDAVKRVAECKEIMIADDTSTDNSENVIQKLAKTSSIPLKFIKQSKHVDFAVNVNTAVKQASGDIVVLLNSDVYPKTDFLTPLMKYFNDPKVFAVGMMDESIEENKIVRRGRGIGEWKRGFYVHQRGEVDKTDTAWVNGGSGAFRHSTFLNLGGFDPIYSPFYWEDIDLSYRAIKAGYRVIFEPKSVVVHEHDRGAILRQFTRKDITVISYRNQFIFVWRNATFTQFIVHLLWLPFHVITAILAGNFLLIKGLFTGIIRYGLHFFRRS